MKTPFNASLKVIPPLAGIEVPGVPRFHSLPFPQWPWL
jgi:hypothetical protein